MRPTYLHASQLYPQQPGHLYGIATNALEREIQCEDKTVSGGFTHWSDDRWIPTLRAWNTGEPPIDQDLFISSVREQAQCWQSQTLDLDLSDNEHARQFALWRAKSPAPEPALNTTSKRQRIEHHADGIRVFCRASELMEDGRDEDVRQVTIYPLTEVATAFYASHPDCLPELNRHLDLKPFIELPAETETVKNITWISKPLHKVAGLPA